MIIIYYLSERSCGNTARPTLFFILFKEWTMSCVRPSNSGCTRIVRRAWRQRKRCSRQPRASLATQSLLPKCSPNYPNASRIGWTHTGHCALLLEHSKTFFTLKSRFFCTDQIANSARARVVFTGSTFRFTCTCMCCFHRQHFRFVDLSTLNIRCFCNHFGHVF